MNVTEEVTIRRPNVSTLLSSAFIKGEGTRQECRNVGSMNCNFFNLQTRVASNYVWESGLFWLFGLRIYWYNHKSKEKHNCTILNGHRDILKTWRLMGIILFRQRCQLKGSVCCSIFSCSLAAPSWTSKLILIHFLHRKMILQRHI